MCRLVREDPFRLAMIVTFSESNIKSLFIDWQLIIKHSSGGGVSLQITFTSSNRYVHEVLTSRIVSDFGFLFP